jgi:hypothetical protein
MGIKKEQKRKVDNVGDLLPGNICLPYFRLLFFYSKIKWEVNLIFVLFLPIVGSEPMLEVMQYQANSWQEILNLLPILFLSKKIKD